MLGEVLRRLEPWAQRDRVGWQQLVRLMLYWSLFRRLPAEHAGILALVRQNATNLELMREVEIMAQQMKQNYEQELLARGQQQGRQEGKVQGRLETYREILGKQLAKRFPILPESVRQRIDSADLPWLEAALDRVGSLQSPDDLLAS